MNKTLRIPRVLCCAMFVTMPWLLLGIISLLLQKNAFGANPVWTDEIVYFRSLKALCESGFPRASNGSFEASAYWLRFGSEGIVPAMLYSLFGLLFGTGNSSILLINAAWISLAALTFVLLRKPDCRRSLLLTASFLTYVPVILYITTSMTELFCYALLLFYAAFLLSWQEKRKPVFLVLTVLVCMLGCVFRPYYGWLIVPVALSAFDYRVCGKSVLVTIGLGMLCFLCCIAGQMMISADYQSFLYRLFHAESPYIALRMLASHCKSNLLDVVTRGECTAPELLLLAGYTATMLILLISGAIRSARRDLLWMGLLMGAVLLTTVALYDLRNWRGFRMLAPILWFAMLYCLCTASAVRILPAAVVSLIALVWLILNPMTGAFRDAERFAQPVNNPILSEAVQIIQFDEAAENPFDNTLRTDLYSLQLSNELDSRIGVQYGWLSTDTVEKSRWLLTDRLRCAITGYECVADLNEYKVYRKISPEDNRNEKQ